MLWLLLWTLQLSLVQNVKDCPDGYFGVNCERECRHPNYGAGCQEFCGCMEEMCNHMSGCQETAVETTIMQSTLSLFNNTDMPKNESKIVYIFSDLVDIFQKDTKNKPSMWTLLDRRHKSMLIGIIVCSSLLLIILTGIVRKQIPKYLDLYLIKPDEFRRAARIDSTDTSYV
ncbi:uncharacterized protein LOC133204359 [Saccostrea echinata]|uniref:uncharacterized protein LOC133204359 n=1 Tax=Saccostrea echinata TaxID=191078 RepID=UPI002A832A2A|nr:uncharacterized protein LOC133204359 [Saccostrea echinata]